MIKQIAKLGLTLTLFLIGANLSRDAIKTVGIRPMLQGVLLWIVVSVTGLVAVQMSKALEDALNSTGGQKP